MSIRTDPVGLSEEVRVAESENRALIGFVEEMVSRMHGPFFSRKTLKGTETFEYQAWNFPYSFVSFTLPLLLYNNPKVRIRSSKESDAWAHALGLEHFTNKWIRENELRRILEIPVTSMFWAHGVVLVGESYEEGVAGRQDGEPPRMRAWPTAKSLYFGDFVRDPAARQLDECRFYAHRWVRTRDELLEEAEKNPDEGWDKDYIQTVASAQYSNAYGRERVMMDAPSRHWVSGWDVWVPDVRTNTDQTSKKGYHGSLYSIPDAPASDGPGYAVKFLRNPDGFYGPEWGPYTIFGVHQVPGSPYHLGPLVGLEGNNRELNRHVRAMTLAAENFNRGIIVRDPELVQVIKSNRFDGVWSSKAPLDNDSFREFTRGGIAPEQMAAVEYLVQQLEQVSGFSEARRGAVTGRGTATEAAIAEGASTAQMDFLKQTVHDSTRQVLRTVAWYANEDERVKEKLSDDYLVKLYRQATGMKPTERGPSAAELMQQFGVPHWQGGQGQGYVPFGELELEIEPMSMERMDSLTLQTRTLQAHQIKMQMLQLMPMMPYVDWKDEMERMGDALNIPDFASNVDFDAVEQMLGAVPQMGQPQPTMQMSGTNGHQGQRSGGQASNAALGGFAKQSTTIPGNRQMAMRGPGK